MKRTTKPPAVPVTAHGVAASAASTGGRREAAPPRIAVDDLEDPIGEAETPHRPPEPTLLAGTPPLAWPPAPPHRSAPSYPSEPTPVMPRAGRADARSRPSLPEEIWANRNSTHDAPPAPQQLSTPMAVATAAASGEIRASGSYRSVSGERAVAHAEVAPSAQPMAFGYVLASVVLLAIALVGFGLWLAFEVISL